MTTVLVGNRNIEQSDSDPIAAAKLQHIYKIDRAILDIARALQFQVGTRAKVGGTAGFVVGAADNLPYVATLPASQTGSTLIIPIDGLPIGATITGFRVVAQIESVGGAVTLDGDLRATTNVAADPTDASIGTMTQVSVTADTAASQEKTGLTEVVTSGKTYYLKLTATTAAATDIIVQACEIYIQEGGIPLGTHTIHLFTADKAGTIEDFAAVMDVDGSSTSITVDLQKRPATSLLSSTISLTHGTGDLTEAAGTLISSPTYVAGDVVVAIVTVTSATGARGLSVRCVRRENSY